MRPASQPVGAGVMRSRLIARTRRRSPNASPFVADQNAPRRTIFARDIEMSSPISGRRQPSSSPITSASQYALAPAKSAAFFASGAIYFVKKGIEDWGLKRSVGRGPLNLVPLVVDLKQ